MNAREQFESWLVGTFSDPISARIAIERRHKNSEEYDDERTEAAWEAWQAARSFALEEAAKSCDELQQLALEDMDLEQDERYGVYAKKYRNAALRIRALKDKE